MHEQIIPISLHDQLYGWPTQSWNGQLHNLEQDNSSNNLIDKWSIQIQDATLEASKMHKDALPVRKWERNLDILKAQVFQIKMKLSK